MTMEKVGLHYGNITWCFMTHGATIRSVDCDGRTCIIIIIIIIIIHEVLFNALRRH